LGHRIKSRSRAVNGLAWEPRKGVASCSKLREAARGLRTADA